MPLPGALSDRAPALRAGTRSLVMGILNITPDSFSGDGLAGGVEAAVARAVALEAAGADVIDVGGESTRPGHRPVGAAVELGRVLPVLEQLAGKLTVPVSIDTRRASVAEAALAAGASILNDVSGLTYDPRMADVAARSGAALIVGHWRQRTDDDPADEVERVGNGLAESVRIATAAGVARTRLIVDPGLGFAKLPPVSLTLLGRQRELHARLGLPILIGASRKGFVGAVLGQPVTERLDGSLATVAVSVAAGADLVRVHDVAASVHAARMADAIVYGWDEVPATWTPVYLGLGVNLGERQQAIARTIQELDAHRQIRVLRRASLFETAPVGVLDQPPFINTVVEALTTLSGRGLLDTVKRLERSLGRESRERWGPREIDVDVLLHGGATLSEPGLEVPHRRLWERLFVLAPLAELRPDLAGPDGRPIGDHVRALAATQEVRSLGW